MSTCPIWNFKCIDLHKKETKGVCTFSKTDMKSKPFRMSETEKNSQMILIIYLHMLAQQLGISPLDRMLNMFSVGHDICMERLHIRHGHGFRSTGGSGGEVRSLRYSPRKYPS